MEILYCICRSLIVVFARAGYGCAVLIMFVLYIFFSFTLNLAHIKVGRGRLVLRHSFPHFPPNSGENIKYFISLKKMNYLILSFLGSGVGFRHSTNTHCRYSMESRERTLGSLCLPYYMLGNFFLQNKKQ